MKISKSQLMKTIQEEYLVVVGEREVTEGDMDKFDPEPGDEDYQAPAPPELVNSWAQEVHKFIKSQWSADSDFSSVREERPAIVAALQQVAAELGSEEAPEPYLEGDMDKFDPEPGDEDYQAKDADPVALDIKDAIQMLEHEDDPSGGLFHVINRLQEALEKLESQGSRGNY
jgi:hypothetical protein